MKLPGNMQQMMQQAQKMQEKMQQEVAQIRVEATAGGGMVTVKMDGQKNVLGVKIDPEVSGDVEMLQDMAMAAFNEAAKKVDEETRQKGHCALSLMLLQISQRPSLSLTSSTAWASCSASSRDARRT